MKISEILLQNGLFSKEIKDKLNAGQIFINGIPTKENIELGEITFQQEIGCFICELCKNTSWSRQLNFIGPEDLVESNVKNDLTTHLSNFRIIRFSKKNAIVINGLSHES